MDKRTKSTKDKQRGIGTVDLVGVLSRSGNDRLKR